MDSLHENEVYHIKKGRTLDDDDGPVKDVITAGLESLCEGTKNPISEYNNIFTRLQTRRKMKPVLQDHFQQQGPPTFQSLTLSRHPWTS